MSKPRRTSAGARPTPQGLANLREDYLSWLMRTDADIWLYKETGAAASSLY